MRKLKAALVECDWSTVDQGRKKNRFKELFASTEKSSEPQILPRSRLQKLGDRLMESVKSMGPIRDNGD